MKSFRAALRPFTAAAVAAIVCLGGGAVWAQAPGPPPAEGKTAIQRPGSGSARPAAMRSIPRSPRSGPAPEAPATESRSPARRPPGVGLPKPGSGTGAISSRVTSIQGAAWHSDNTPVPNAVLRLRNVVTGRIEAVTIAAANGTFAFNGIPDGTYLIEMVSDSGKVLMVGHTFTVAPGETVATFVRLGPKVPWFNGFFGNAAQTVSSSAATTGVTAVAPDTVIPVSSSR